MNEKKPIRACPVCQNNALVELLHSQNFVLPEDHPLPAKYDVVACKNCGFVYADTPADQGTYDKYYAKMSKYEMDYSCANSSLYLDRVAWIIPFIHDQSGSVIDIGCGNGQLLLELKKRGLSDLTGLDPSERCVLDLKRNGIKGIKNSIFSITEIKQFDCAILSGVLEHIFDVSRIMETMTRLIKCRGLLFVFVPDASRYLDFDSVPFDYFNVEHINHFEETSLVNLGLQHGFHTMGLLKTTISLSHTMQPVVFCVYENGGGPAVKWRASSRNCVSEYIERTRKKTGENQNIKRLIETKEEIIVWGAGNYTSRLLANSGLGKCNIVMIVDNDRHKQGTAISGKTVFPPTAICENKKMAAILVVASVFSDEIVAEIRRMGLDNKIILLNCDNGKIS